MLATAGRVTPRDRFLGLLSGSSFTKHGRFTRDYGLVSLSYYCPAELFAKPLFMLEWLAHTHRGDAEEGKVEETVRW